MATIKGQNLRIFLAPEDEGDTLVVAAAQTCTAHIGVQFAEDTTKDTDDDWINQEPVGLNWDVQTEALVVDDEDNNALNLERLVVGQIYAVQFLRTQGWQNRQGVQSDINLIGYAVLSDLQINSNDKEIATATAQFTGVSDLSFMQTPIRQYIDSKNCVYEGIVNINYQGYLYAAAKSTYNGDTWLFLISHNGILVTAEEEADSITDCVDVPGKSLEAEYDNIKYWVEHGSSGCYVRSKADSYDYNVIQGTGIIGASYEGEITS